MKGLRSLMNLVKLAMREDGQNRYTHTRNLASPGMHSHYSFYQHGSLHTLPRFSIPPLVNNRPPQITLDTSLLSNSSPFFSSHRTERGFVGPKRRRMHSFECAPSFTSVHLALVALFLLAVDWLSRQSIIYVVPVFETRRFSCRLSDDEYDQEMMPFFVICS